MDLFYDRQEGGISSVVVEVLHRDLAGKVGEKGDDIAGAVLRRGVAERGDSVGISDHLGHAVDALSGRRHGRGLGYGVDADMLLATVQQTEVAGDGLALHGKWMGKQRNQ